MCFHLKRFEHFGVPVKGKTSSKIDAHVQFPLDGLDMRPYLVPDRGPPALFDLFACIVHIGTLHWWWWCVLVRPRG